MDSAAKRIGAAFLNEEGTKEIGLEPEAVASPGQVAANGAIGEGNISLDGPDGAPSACAGVMRGHAYEDVRAAEGLVAGQRAVSDCDGRRRHREERSAA